MKSIITIFIVALLSGVVIKNNYYVTLHTKIRILPRMCWGPNGNFGVESNSLLDTFTNKWGNILGRAFVQFDGDVDPLNGQFDWDTTRAGFQLDSTLATGLLQRPGIHDVWNMGVDSQICVVVDLERKYNINVLAWFDSTGGAVANVADVTFCDSLEELRALLLQYEGTWGSPTPDLTLSSSATRGWKYDSSFGTKSCQFVIIRYNRKVGTYPNETGAAFTSFVLYGATVTPAVSDTRITPDWSVPFTRDTCYPVSQLSGFVEAWPTPAYSNWRTDTAANWMGLGGYISAFSTTGGVFDKYNGSFVSPSNVNVKWDAQPYGGPIFNTSDTTYYKAHRNYNVDRVGNTYLLTQTGGANLNYIPLDSSTADRRKRLSYQRYRLQFLRGASRTCYEVPDTTNSIGQYLRETYIANNPHSGRYAWGLYKYYIPFNENWAGYRDGSIAGSNFMPPNALFEFHDYLKSGWDSVFHVMPFVTQGFAAWGMEGIIEAEFIGRVKYLNRNHPLGNIYNLHPTISTWVRNVDGGCAGNGNSQGYLAGVRLERAKFQAFLDTMAILNGGVFHRGIVTEIAMESHTGFAVPDSTCTNGVSGLGVKQIGANSTWISQSMHITQSNVAYYFVEGIEAVYGYEMMDASDSSSMYYNLPDGSAGRVQGYHNYYKPVFFDEGAQHKLLQNLRGIRSLINSDSAQGNFNGIMRNVTSRDSFCLVLYWGGYSSPASARTYSLYSDVTNATQYVHKNTTDWTFTMTTSSPTVTSGTVSITPTQQPIYVKFKSPLLAAALDAAWRGFPINLRNAYFVNTDNSKNTRTGWYKPYSTNP